MAASNTSTWRSLQLRPGEARRSPLPLADPLTSEASLCAGAASESTRPRRLAACPRPRAAAALHAAASTGPCMRCLDGQAGGRGRRARGRPARRGDEELDSPYVDGEELACRHWAHDALALALPAQLLCRPDCAGLCPVCGESLNDADPASARRARTPAGRSRASFSWHDRGCRRVKLIGLLPCPGPWRSRRREPRAPAGTSVAPTTRGDAAPERVPPLSQPEAPASGLPGLRDLRRP